MNKPLNITFCLFVMLCGVLFLSQTCRGADDGDFQYWTGTSFSFDINKDWKFTFQEEFRLGDDADRLYYHHSDMGFTYKSFRDWIDLGFNYRQVFERDSKDRWRRENRPHLNVTFKGRLFDFPVSSRSRFEFRDREVKKDLWRYRNKFTVKLPVELTELRLQPYIADEVFINFDEEGYNRNRLSSGFSFRLSEDVAGEVFYLWQSSRAGGGREDINVLGAHLKFYF